MSIQTQSRTALRELIALLQEVDERWCGPEWNVNSAEDVAASHRAFMHILESGVVSYFEQAPTHPDLRRIATPTRKALGDCSDAVYFDAPICPEHSYVVRGTIHGASYFSLSIDNVPTDGRWTGTVGASIDHTKMEIEDDGAFTIYLGGDKREGNWLPLTAEAGRVMTRHFFEEENTAADDPDLEPRMHIECLSATEPPGPPDDASIAADIRRVTTAIRYRTLEMPVAVGGLVKDFVSTIPNVFPQPQSPGNQAATAGEEAFYCMAPFLLGPDEALVITGRWPDCHFGNVCLWNRFRQTFDFTSRTVSLNRNQTVLEDDGSFRMILAHEDPGLPNWMDTEGKLSGLIFWRFFLVTGDVEAPQGTVMKLADLRVEKGAH